MQGLNRQYKAFAIVTLIVGVALILIPSDEMTIEDRIWKAFLLNVGYHLMYQLLSRMPIGLFHFISKQNPKVRELNLYMLVIFSAAVIIGTSIAILVIVYTAISRSDLNNLIIIPFLISVILGAISSLIKLREE